MKANYRHSPIYLLFPLFLAAFSTAALSADAPKRKSGLWEMNMRMEGVQNMGPMQQCIDQNSDNIMQQQAKNQKQECSVMDVKTSGSKVIVHSVCKMDRSVATTDGTFEGAFDSAYRGTMKTRYVPPYQGMSESNMSMDARWLGPCKAGQKPGDVIMPGMGSMNVNEMMKDPQIQKMMKQQQQQR